MGNVEVDVGHGKMKGWVVGRLGDGILCGISLGPLKITQEPMVISGKGETSAGHPVRHVYNLISRCRYQRYINYNIRDINGKKSSRSH
eukprot:700917-Amorphochlora_amoeboformis.AAC.2